MHHGTEAEDEIGTSFNIPSTEELDAAMAELLDTVSFDVDPPLDADGRPVGIDDDDDDD